MILEFVTRSDVDEARCAVVFKDGSQVGLAEGEDEPLETEQDGSVEAE